MASQSTLPLLLVGGALALGAVALSCFAMAKALGAQRDLDATRRRLQKEMGLRKMERYVGQVG